MASRGSAGASATPATRRAAAVTATQAERYFAKYRKAIVPVGASDRGAVVETPIKVTW
jgi:hypothetical protein